MRIGHGYDVHRFGDADDAVGLVLGGVAIPYHRRLLAHSDGDVLIHAICDALLGAIGEGDIGHHYPDTDQANADIDSRELLRDVVKKMQGKGWRVCNIDSTLVAQAPKMATYISAMKTNLAADLAVAPERVNVKATTTEKLGFSGRGEGIAAHAVALLEPLS